VLEVVSDRKLGQLLYTYSAATSGTHVYNAQSNEYIYVGTGGNFNQFGSTTEVNYDSYKPEVITYSDYYPFHMQMEGRSDVSNGYRYHGANGQESEREITGTGSHSSAEYWMYDGRLGRRWNVEPKRSKLPDISTYSTYKNSPILNADQKGDYPIPFPYISAMLMGNPNTAMNFSRSVESSIDGVAYAFSSAYEVLWTYKYYWFDQTHSEADEKYHNELLFGDKKNAVGFKFNKGFYKTTFNSGSADDVYRFIFGALSIVPLETALLKVMTVSGTRTIWDKIRGFVKSKTSKEWNRTVRSSHAKSFMGEDAYRKYGGDKSIDFKRDVSEVSHGPESDVKLVQYRDPSNPNASPFFTYEGVDPSTLGIPATHTSKYYVKLDKSYDFLKSTAGDVDAFKVGDVGTYKGGGTQLFSEEAAKNATFIPAD